MAPQMRSTFEGKILRDVLADADAGSGRTVLLSGPLAAGKTRLLDEFAEFAAGQGARVLRASCPPAGLTLAGVRRQLLGPLDTAGDENGGNGVEQEITRTAQAIVRLSAAATVVVCVDDLRHADLATARLLTELATTGAASPVLVVATDRVSSPSRTHLLLNELGGRSSFRKVSLTGLSIDQLQESAVAEFGIRPTDDTASWMLRLSNGNPLITTALLRDLTAQQGSGPAGWSASTTVGPAYAQAVLDCLRRLDPEVREIAEAIAVVGDCDQPRLIAELTREESAAVEEARYELVAAGLLADSGFRHPVVREAVLGDIPRRRRALLSRRTASALHKDGVPAEQAAQWLESFQHGEVPAQLPQRFSGEEFRVSGRRLETLWDARDLLGTIEEDIRDLASRENLRMTDLESGKLLVACEFPGLLRQAVDQRVPRPRIDTGSVPGARYAAAWSLAGILTGRTEAAQSLRLAEQALERSIFTDETAPAVLAAITAHLLSEEPAKARAWCDRFLLEARDRYAVPWQALLTALRAESALREGDHAGAIADANRALRLLPAQLWGVRIGGPLGTLLLAHTLAGSSAKAAVLLRRRVPESMFETRYGLGYLYARGHHHLAAGDHLPALADFLRCGRVLADWGLDDDRRTPWQLSVAATYMATGDYSKAVERIVQVLDHGRHAVAGTTDADSRFDRHEAVFEQLRAATGSAGLPTVLATLLREGPARGGEPADVPRYKIYDRNTVCLQQLSPSERRVALLAAKGESNQKIARELSVTVSTVEQHLTRTYRKLQLADRQELRTRLG